MNQFQILSVGMGLLMLAVGAWGLLLTDGRQRFASTIPRNVWLGRILFLLDLAWSLYLLRNMTLGDFETLSFVLGPINITIPVKSTAYLLSPLIYLYVVVFVPDFLGARSVGLLMILLAKPVLWICYLSDSPYSVVIAGIAYLWIIMGMCIVAVPHWMRDLITFWSAKKSRWKFASTVRIVLGVVLVVIGFIAK